MSRVVLITGCSTGIGRALAEACLSRGDHVIATARKASALDYLADKESATRLTLDVNNEDNLRDVFAKVTEDFGKIDLLINNAGYAAMGPVVELQTDELQQQFATNVFAPVAVTRHALPLLRAAGTSMVINVGSVSGVLTTPFSGAYCATKAALHSLSDAMRMELAPFGIRVLTVQPGAIQSSFGDNSLAGVEHLLTEGSAYRAVEDKIRERAVASQQNPTTAGDFANQLLDHVEKGSGPVVRIGNGSTALPAMRRWLPLKLIDRILSKKFGLDKIKAG